MKELWCIRISGPEDLYAHESKEAAELHNKVITEWYKQPADKLEYLPTLENMKAVVELWPYGDESHAAELVKKGGESCSSDRK